MFKRTTTVLTHFSCIHCQHCIVQISLFPASCQVVKYGLTGIEFPCRLYEFYMMTKLAQ